MVDPHWGYIAAAYGAAALVVVWLITWVFMRHRVTRAALRALEKDEA